MQTVTTIKCAYCREPLSEANIPGVIQTHDECAKKLIAAWRGERPEAKLEAVNNDDRLKEEYGR